MAEAIALQRSGASLLDYPRAGAGAILLMLPGGLIRADRYDWLAALDCRVVILDGALSAGCFSAAGAPAPPIVELAEALALLAGTGLPIHVVGHSAGAAAILDALDPPSNPAAHLPPGWALPLLPASVTVMGCSLQRETLGMVLPHRSEDRPLLRPADVPMLCLAGENDAMAPPALARRTCARFTPAVPLVVMREATHYGWAGPREDGDNPLSDTDPGLDTASQRERTLSYLATMLAGQKSEI